MSILDATLLEQFAYQCGKTTWPIEFILWSGLALIASSVEDRVYIDRLRGQPLYPNIYVFLISESGVGKTMVSNEVTDFTDQLPINVHNGRVTAPGLIDLMSKPTMPGRRAASRLLLVTSELKNELRGGPLAADFIAQMTAAYTGQKSFSDVTRMSGMKIVKNCVITWLAGTTPDWLFKTLTADDIRSGFGARIVPVIIENWNEPERAPIYPSDVDRVERFVLARLKSLCYTSGEMTLTPAASDIEQAWLDGRVAHTPASPDEKPAYRREPVLMLKLAMLFSLSESDSLVIEARHIRQAQETCARLRKNARKLLEMASSGGRTTNIAVVRDFLRRQGVVGRSALTVFGSRRGILALELTAIVNSLVAVGELKAARRATGAIEYRWQERKLPALPDDDAETA